MYKSLSVCHDLQYSQFTEEIKEYLDESGLNDVISMEGLVSKVVNTLGKGHV